MTQSPIIAVRIYDFVAGISSRPKTPIAVRAGLLVECYLSAYRPMFDSRNVR